MVTLDLVGNPAVVLGQIRWAASRITLPEGVGPVDRDRPTLADVVLAMSEGICRQLERRRCEPPNDQTVR